MSDTETIDETTAGTVAETRADAGPERGLAIPEVWPIAGLRPHRFAGIFRMLSADEHARLAADIAERGLLNRIVVFDGAVLDGRNRYLALVDTGAFDPEEDAWEDFPELFEPFAGNEDGALEFVWSVNEQRRHDTPTQRAMSAQRYANLRDVTLAEAARRFGVSERQVSSAQHVAEHGVPELGQAMDEGRIPAYLAEQVADLDDDEQRDVVRAEKPAKAAREKLAEPPPLATSGEVIKALDPSVLVMFSAAVLKVGAMGHTLTPATLDALAREYDLLADADGALNLSRPVTLAIDLARQKLKWEADRWPRRSALVMAAAGLPEDFDALVQAYRNLIVLYDRAIRTGDAAGEANYGVAMEGVLFKAAGIDFDMPREIDAAARAPDGAVPMWGQQGCFVAEGEWRDYRIKAIVSLGKFHAVYAVTPGAPFPSETGFLSLSWDRFGDREVEKYGVSLVQAAIRTHLNNLYGPMPVPQTVYRLDDGAVTGPVAMDIAGLELDRTAYDAALAALTEPRGKLHQGTATDAITAGVAAGISRAQMAEDLGHPIGTIQTWTARLGLTDPARLKDTAAKVNAHNKAQREAGE